MILIIEDDRELREMLKMALLKKDYNILESENGKDALIHFKPSVTDLVITDLIMPEEDGLKVIMKMKALKQNLKIIAISGGGKAAPGNYLDLAKALGADAVFAKPFSVNDLILKIDALLKPEHSD